MQRVLLSVLMLLLLVAGVIRAVLRTDSSPAAGRPAAAQPLGAPPPVAEAPPGRRRVALAPRPGSVAAAAPAPAAAAREEDAPFVLRVRTATGGRAIPGLVFLARDDLNRVASTDPEGLLRFRARPGEDELVVSADAPGAAAVRVTRDESELLLPEPLPLVVRVVGHETGTGIEAGVSWVGADPEGEPWVAEEKPAEAFTYRAAPLWPGYPYDLRLSVSPSFPRNTYVRPRERETRYTGRMAIHAERAELVVAVAPRADVTVRVLDTGGAAVPGASVGVVSSAGGRWNVATQDDGAVRPRDVPFFRGARLTVWSAFEGRSAAGTARLARLADPVTIDLVLPDRPDPDGETIGIGGGAGGAFGGRRGSRRTLGPPGTAVLVVQVVRRDGRPAAGVHVGWTGTRHGGAAADAGGIVQVTELPAGVYDVVIDEPGIGRASETVELADGETRRVVLAEPAGRALLVRVVDVRAEPLPLARIALLARGGVDIPWVEDGLQRLVVVADPRGERRLDGVVPDVVSVRASYGGRSADAPVGADGVVVVTVPD